MPHASLQTLSEGASAMQAVSDAIAIAAEAIESSEPAHAEELRSVARAYRVKLMALEASIAVLRSQVNAAPLV